MRGYSLSESMASMLRAAHAEATRLDLGYVSPDLLLLGMLAEEGTLGAVLLSKLGVTRELVRQAVDQQIGRLVRNEGIPGRRVPYTSAAKRALEGAMDEASELGHSYVGTEHVLLGILRDSQSDTSRMLAKHDVTVDRVRKELDRLRLSS